MYSTVAVNSLTEAAHLPAEGVHELIGRDYELEWLGCNVCFYNALLFGLAATAGLSGYICAPHGLRPAFAPSLAVTCPAMADLGPFILFPVLCMLTSMTLLMLSVFGPWTFEAIGRQGPAPYGLRKAAFLKLKRGACGSKSSASNGLLVLFQPGHWARRPSGRPIRRLVLGPRLWRIVRHAACSLSAATTQRRAQRQELEATKREVLLS